MTEVHLFCQKCGNKFSSDKLKDTMITYGQQKGLILQLCPICRIKYDRPQFMNRAIYK